MKKLIYFFFLELKILVFSSFAEFRVYQYYYKNLSNPKELPTLNLSTLDPLSYPLYHGMNDGDRSSLLLLRSWKCYGARQNDENFCPSPESLFLKDQLQKIK